MPLSPLNTPSRFPLLCVILSETIWCLVLMLNSKESLLLLTFEFLPSLLHPLTLTFLVDKMALWFIASVTLISGAVFSYSLIYMANEPAFMRFHTLVLIFILSMLLLTLSTDLVTLLIGWDGLGVSSFLLVVYFQSNSSWNAGILTLMSNRVGDVLLLVGTSVTSVALVSDLTLMQTVVPNTWVSPGNHWHSLSVMCGVLAALTKSAQFPFSAWLPAAMAAPTPVSALVHSSTLVTAGVYVLIRLSGAICAFAPKSVLWFSMCASVATILLAGTAALFEYDLKKVVALSTLSQLGFMVHLALAELPVFAFYHLLTHAFFKSLLFMAVGSAIHSAGGGQDLRSAHLSPSALPVTTSLMVLTNMSLMGLPFMSGHYSKDAFLETVSASWGQWPSSALWLMLMGGVCLTCAYTSRFLFLLLSKELKSPPLAWESESDLELMSPCWGQAFLSFEVGLFLSCFWLPNSSSYPSIMEKHLLLSVVVVVFACTGPLLMANTPSKRAPLTWVGGLSGLNLGVKSIFIRPLGANQLNRMELLEREVWGYLTYGAIPAVKKYATAPLVPVQHFGSPYLFAATSMGLLLSVLASA